jgi:hypothetical protein
MSHGELAQLEVVRARIEELQERHWFAEKQGKHHRKQLVDRIMHHSKKK